MLKRFMYNQSYIRVNDKLNEIVIKNADLQKNIDKITIKNADLQKIIDKLQFEKIINKLQFEKKNNL